MDKKTIVVGLRQVKKGIRANGVERVYLAKDADWSIRLVLEELCRSRGIALTYVPSKHALGREVGINVPAATAAQLI